jgi:Rrf2 family protein
MQITRQAEYALRTVLFLAKQETNQKVSTSRIAKEKNIPNSFLAKIISQLSIAGLIHTSRGAHGGVTLSKPAEKISMLDVVEAIDGPVTLNECIAHPDECEFGKDCPLHEVWCKSQAELVEKLRSAHFDKFVKSNPDA